MEKGVIGWHAKYRLARVGLEPGHELLEVLCIDCGACHNAELEPCEQRDRYEISCAVKARLKLDHRQQVHRRTGGHQDRGPVGPGALDGLDSDHPITAGAVFDVTRPTKKLPAGLAQDPAQASPAPP